MYPPRISLAEGPRDGPSLHHRGVRVNTGTMPLKRPPQRQVLNSSTLWRTCLSFGRTRKASLRGRSRRCMSTVPLIIFPSWPRTGSFLPPEGTNRQEVPYRIIDFLQHYPSSGKHFAETGTELARFDFTGGQGGRHLTDAPPGGENDIGETSPSDLRISATTPGRGISRRGPAWPVRCRPVARPRVCRPVRRLRRAGRECPTAGNAAPPGRCARRRARPRGDSPTGDRTGYARAR